MRMTLIIVVGIPLVILLYFYVLKDIIDKLRGK